MQVAVLVAMVMVGWERMDGGGDWGWKMGDGRWEIEKREWKAEEVRWKMEKEKGGGRNPMPVRGSVYTVLAPNGSYETMIVDRVDPHK
ncbi:hypothetical protein TWF718_003492 [Orbilia javanica]|uniref:Uncharacterized protein n=1 Tax=Orbilia javanica TaxID=47235 RepID=A0AAN8MM20_9PEZI